MIRRETWIVLGIFVIALAGLIWWQRYGKQTEAEETPAAAEQDQFLFDFSGAALQAVRLERVGDKVVQLQKDAPGAWQIAWPPDQRADSAALDSKLGQLAAVSVMEKMQAAPALGAMGLTPPLYRLLLNLEDGRQLVANVGNKTPTGSGYYVLTNQEVYIVNSFSLDPILELIDSLPLQPTPTAAQVNPTLEVTPDIGLPSAATTTPAGTP